MDCYQFITIQKLQKYMQFLYWSPNFFGPDKLNDEIGEDDKIGIGVRHIDKLKRFFTVHNTAN